MQLRAVFLPPLVRDLVCYDRTTLPLSPQDSDPPGYLCEQGMLSIQVVQSCIPQSVIAVATATCATTADDTTSINPSAVTTSAVTATDPHDLDPFKAACVVVQSELMKLFKGSLKPLKEVYADSIEWLGVPGKKSAEIWFELYENKVFDQALIVGSTVLEQLINNIIFTLQGPDKFIPFLVRDLLAVRCLTKCIDRTLIRVLKTMIGSPLTLNIRNLLWHGFIVPDDDIPLDAYGAMLIAVTMTIARDARNILSTTPLAIRHQNTKAFYIGQETVTTTAGNFDVLYEKITFEPTPPSLDSSRLVVMMNGLVKQSHFVTPGTAQQWIAACQHLEPESKSSFVFVMTTLPLLEHALRLLYVSVNQCKQDRRSALIAGEYYLTLDVILDKMVPTEYYDEDSVLFRTSGSTPNQLYTELGEKVMNLLNDLFTHGFGPRIRDRTSHGELNSYLIDIINEQPWFNFYMGLVIHLLCKYQPSSTGFHQEAADYTSWITEYTTCRFDEWSVLKRETARCQVLLLEYSALASANAISETDISENSHPSESDPLPLPIDLILTFENATVFSSHCILSDENWLEKQLGCLSCWPSANPVKDLSTLRWNVFASNNLSAWIIILQSIQSAIQKVTVKVKVLSGQLRQRQLSSRARKQVVGMQPMIPRFLGMLKGCLALVEHFVLNPTLVGAGPGSGSGSGIQPDYASTIDDNPNGSTSVQDKSSTDEILLRLKITTFVDKFVSNFDRAKLNMIEPAWEELMKTVAVLEARRLQEEGQGGR